MKKVVIKWYKFAIVYIMFYFMQSVVFFVGKVDLKTWVRVALMLIWTFFGIWLSDKKLSNKMWEEK
jgi:membrane protein YdbS with pleckstrin-like domain